MELYDGLASSAVALVQCVPDSALSKFDILPQKLLQCADSYHGVVDAITRRLRIYNNMLTESAMERRKLIETNMRKSARNGFLSHSQDYISELKAQLNDLLMQHKSNGNAPEYDKLLEQYSGALHEKDKLGIFAGKEKKAAIEAKIACYREKMEEIEPEVKSMRAELAPQIKTLKTIITFLETPFDE
jgi:hypothetical protein